MIKITIIPFLCLLIGIALASTRPNKDIKEQIYPEELPGTFTGGFGEDTCHSCHFDYPLNPADGSLTLEGIPERYEPGEKYIFSIFLSREKLGQAGFQLSSRYKNGDQAGSFEVTSDQLQFTGTENEIQYLQHTLKGSKLNNSATHSWQVTWKAPKCNRGTVVFNIAANAGNGDASAFGDYIFTEEIVVPFE